jgi:hypothetical protein
MTIETILNSDMSVAYITDCATSPVFFYLLILHIMLELKFVQNKNRVERRLLGLF